MTRSFLLLTLLLGLSSQAYSFEFAGKELEGNYQVWMEGSSVKNQVVFGPEDKVLMVEKRPAGELRCYGKADQLDQVLRIAMICQNGRKFQQAIDFSAVEDLESFKAPVYSSLYHRTVLLNFAKSAPALR